MVPYIGPFLSAIPAVLIGIGISPIMAVASASVYFLVQQLENYIFVPKIMQRSTGVHPVIVLLSLAIGLRLAGIIGLLISVPVYITLRVILNEIIFKKG
jgi:predicted PurR-regulated permease PerM